LRESASDLFDHEFFNTICPTPAIHRSPDKGPCRVESGHSRFGWLLMPMLEKKRTFTHRGEERVARQLPAKAAK
jgi:hypothetical protein